LGNFIDIRDPRFVAGKTPQRLKRMTRDFLHSAIACFLILPYPAVAQGGEDQHDSAEREIRTATILLQQGDYGEAKAHQQGSLKLEERKRGPDVWVFRWWDTDANGKRVYRKQQVGDLSEYPHESAAKAAIDTLRLTINHQSQRNGVSQMTVQSLWDHYFREELPFKDFSTQDAYTSYARNWILPRWGGLLLQKIKTVEIERWLRDATGSNGTKAKVKCIMSALFSHAVRWEFTSSNPISSGISVGSGGKRGPSTGVRVSAKRAKAPTVLLPEQFKLGLTMLEFRDQLLVLLDGALGTRRGELAALRWQDCDFENDTFQIEHSYYWRRGGILKSTKTEASAKPLPMHPALKLGLLEWRTQSHRTQPTDFVFPSRLHGGRRTLDLAAVLKRKIRPAFEKVGITAGFLLSMASRTNSRAERRSPTWAAGKELPPS